MKNNNFVNDKISAENSFVKYKLMYNFKQEKMNLENLNLVELNAQEVRETEGGLFGIDDLIIGVLVGAAVQVMADWENFEAGLSGQPPRKK